MLILTIVSFVAMVFYLSYYIPNRIYLEADLNNKNGKYQEAIEQFTSIKGWRDTESRITDCYLLMFESALHDDRISDAFEIYDMLSERDSQLKNPMLNSIYDFATEKMNTDRQEEALELFSGILSGYMDSEYIYNGYYYEKGIKSFDESNYVEAYYLFLSVDTKYFPEVQGKIEECKSIYYHAAVEEFNLLNMKNDALKMDIVLPESFLEPMLDSYMDTDKYRQYVSLVGMWLSKDRQKNIEIVYELDDFFNARESGFAMQRLFQRKYINGWYYFTINKDGVAETNIPHYHLQGYYGLYSKIENGVYYIGSDELIWTKQFSFTFDEYDKVLTVYSYSAGMSYHLTLDDSVIYT